MWLNLGENYFMQMFDGFFNDLFSFGPVPIICKAITSRKKAGVFDFLYPFLPKKDTKNRKMAWTFFCVDHIEENGFFLSSYMI